MKCLTLHQPYASMIACGLKQYETRSKPLKHRGSLGIHAGKKHISNGWIAQIRQSVPIGLRYRVPVHYPLGMLVAIAEMTDCIEMTEELIESIPPMEKILGNWEPGRFAYKLENIQVLDKPFEINGSQGIWNLDDKIVDNLDI